MRPSRDQATASYRPLVAADQVKVAGAGELPQVDHLVLTPPDASVRPSGVNAMAKTPAWSFHLADLLARRGVPEADGAVAAPAETSVLPSGEKARA